MASTDSDFWLSPTGLHFFDPMIEGDHEFYNKLYARMFDCCLWHEDAIREEFQLVAGVIKQGDRVLDVGCGFGSFRRVIPHAHYTGLDPHFAEGSNIEGIFNQTLGEHLARNAGTYDAVCAFQVIEHVKAPVELFADMVRAARPGGLVIAGVPQVPSALTRFPNQLLNAPPHHLTWWTSDALTALARRCGASVVNIEHVPWGDLDALIYWMARFSADSLPRCLLSQPGVVACLCDFWLSLRAPGLHPRKGAQDHRRGLWLASCLAPRWLTRATLRCRRQIIVGEPGVRLP